MELTDLPVEIFQEILSYLSYRELLDASLVCKDWKHAADTLIVLRGSLRVTWVLKYVLDTVQSSNRNYRSFNVYNELEWSLGTDRLVRLQPVLEACVEQFGAQRLRLNDFSGDHVYQFWLDYRSWIEGIESFEVQCTVDQEAYPTKDQTSLPEDLTLKLEFPNLKHLLWDTWFREASRTFTVVAPNLETVLLSFSANNVKILNCDKCKRIEYSSSNSRPFTETFAGQLSNLSSLKLIVEHGDFSFTFLDQMKNLRWIELGIDRYLLLAKALDALYNCGKLLGLKLIAFDIEDSDEGTTLDLEKLTTVLPELQQLELGGMDIQTSTLVKAPNLLLFKLNDVKTNDLSELRIAAPKLETLAISAEMIPYIYVEDHCRLTKLYVYTDEFGDYGDFERALQLDLKPFLEHHSNVKDLSIINTQPGPDTDDENSYDNIKLDVERLELRNLTVAFSFFQQLQEWTSLKHLSLVDCVIDCQLPSSEEVVHLPRLERLVVDGVLPWDPFGLRRTFPVEAPAASGSDLTMDQYNYFRSSENLVRTTKQATTAAQVMPQTTYSKNIFHDRFKTANSYVGRFEINLLDCN